MKTNALQKKKLPKKYVFKKQNKTWNVPQVIVTGWTTVSEVLGDLCCLGIPVLNTNWFISVLKNIENLR